MRTPPAPRRHAGYLTGLVLATVVPTVAVLAGHAAPLVAAFGR